MQKKRIVVKCRQLVRVLVDGVCFSDASGKFKRRSLLFWRRQNEKPALCAPNKSIFKNVLRRARPCPCLHLTRAPRTHKQAHLREIARIEAFRTLPRLGIHTPQLEASHKRLQTLLERVDKMVRFCQEVHLLFRFGLGGCARSVLRGGRMKNPPCS